MSSDELKRSWERTSTFLWDGRNHLDQATEGFCSDEINQLEEYLNSNELELALDELERIFRTTGLEKFRVLELMAAAAASMGLSERSKRYDRELSDARGWVYRTELPD
jgi:hypothetical protein